MKLKKLIAGVSAAALAASMSCAFSASAITLGADKIDFEDGDFSFVYCCLTRKTQKNDTQNTKNPSNFVFCVSKNPL